MAEQLTCNQQVDGSTPFTSSTFLGRFPSGQRGQTVNLLSLTSVVRIHLSPPKILRTKVRRIFSYYLLLIHYYFAVALSARKSFGKVINEVIGKR